MTDTIDYFFTSVSPFAWFGQRKLVEIAARHGKRIAYRPVALPEVWKASGGVPLPQRSPARQRQRLVELQRVADMRGLKVVTQPENFPTNPELADRCIIAIAEAGDDAGPFAFAIGEALWSHDRQIADEAVVAELLESSRNDAGAVIPRARAEETARIREANTRAAIDADAIGSPTYVYRGESFWGQDRLEYLDAMIASGRGAFAPR